MKVVAILGNELNVKQLTKHLNTDGFSNIHIRTLSVNHEQEIMEEVFISRTEKYGFVIGVLIGATIGIIISYLSLNNIMIMPILLRIEAAGEIAVSFFWLMAGIIAGGFLGALSGLAFTKLPTDEGEKMLIVYCGSEKRKKVISIIEEYKGVVI